MIYPEAVPPANVPNRDHNRCTIGLVVLLGVVAVWSFLWPAYRAFLNIEIDMNEGWNAYLADAALGQMPLYPAPDQLVTNNYPPLSFFIVGAAGRVVGDPLLAGRLLSLAAIVGIAAAIALSIRRLGGSRVGAAIGALLFVGTLCRFFVRYAGMDDPQLLAHAVMVFGFAGFIAAWKHDRGYLGSILVMVVAGFIKHNIIAMPATACLWLALCNRREAVKCLSAAGLVTTLLFAACYLLFGRDFFTNMLSPRQGSGITFQEIIGPLKRLDVALLASLGIGWLAWRDTRMRLCSLLIGIGLLTYFLQKTGAGVDVNAIFDLLIGVSIGTGLAISYLPAPPPWLSRVPGSQAWATVLVLALCLRLLPTKRIEHIKAVRLLFDPSFHTEIATREKAMADSIDLVRATPGAVVCSTFVCYRSGKPLTVDRFNAAQRIARGALPKDAIKSRLRNGTLTSVDTDPRADWDESLLASAHGDGKNDLD